MLAKVRKLHKWLMAFVGVQFVIWSITGAYMVFFDIDYIHGDSLVKNHQTTLSVKATYFSVSQLTKQYGELEKLSLGMLINTPVYRIKANNQMLLIDAITGVKLSPLPESKAHAIAQHHYTGEGEVLNSQYIADNAPFELSARHLPVWRIEFDDFAKPTLYISALTGKVVTKRHEFWRLFDWMFRFHVMDYQDSEVDNQLLFWFSLLGILSTCCGLVLVYFRFMKAKGQSSLIESSISGEKLNG